MTSVEERLARDIAAVTGGVVVTEAELQEARAAVAERLDIKRETDRRRTFTVAAAAAVVVTVAGVTAFESLDDGPEEAPPADSAPSDPDPDDSSLQGEAPTAETVRGLWREDNGGTLLLFRRDGTVHVDVRGSVFSDPLVSGTYEIEGDLITVTTASADSTECSGTSFALRVSISEVGSMRSVRAEPRRGVCSSMEWGHEVWEQVLPTSPGMSAWSFSGERGWRPVGDEAVLHGDWMAEGGGHVLEIAADGAYYVVDDTGEPIDQGRWSARGSELTLTSSAGSAECGEGDQLVLGGVQVIDPGTHALRSTVEQNDCGGTWTPDAWIRIPSEDKLA